jgi:hypothetical protein
MNTLVKREIDGRPRGKLQVGRRFIDINNLKQGQIVIFRWIYVVCIYGDDFDTPEDVLLKVESIKQQQIQPTPRPNRGLYFEPLDNTEYVVEFVVQGCVKSDLKVML